MSIYVTYDSYKTTGDIMSNESKLIVEIWDTFRDLIPVAKREDAALHLLRSFNEYGFDVDYSELEEEDNYLDAAIAQLKDEDDDEDLIDEE